MFQKILLVLDGSPSASKASLMAVELAGIHRADLTALFIIDGGWRKILGDEWISSEGLRGGFFKYMEEEQAERARQVLAEMERKGRDRNLQVTTLLKTGEPDRVLFSTCGELGPFDLVILPNPSGKAAEGSVKINVLKAARKLVCPLLIGPA